MKKVVSLLTVSALLLGNAYFVSAEQETKYATREYTVSEFVKSVGRNNLKINDDMADSIVSSFSDSKDIDKNYVSDIARAKEHSLVAGYDDGTLKPKESVKRIEAMAILARSMPEIEEKSELIEFTDVPDWAKADMDRLTKAGLVFGYGDGTLGAEDYITVEQVKMLTDRSDEALNTVSVKDSFYGYANNKFFRNFQLPDGAVIDPIHGSALYSSDSWTNFTGRREAISDAETAILKKLVGGELTYEKGSAEQRVKDVFDCMTHIKDDAEKDAETFNSIRNKILEAKTPEEYVNAVVEIYRDTGINVLIDIVPEADNETNIMYPLVAFAAPTGAAVLAFDKATEEKYAGDYKAVLTEWAGYIDKGFTSDDIEKAYEMQKTFGSSREYLEMYKYIRSKRVNMDENYTLEQYEKDIDNIQAQHPEFYGDDANNKSSAYTLEELDKFDGQIDIEKMLEAVGYHDYDKVLFADADKKIIEEARFTEDNLNAYKLNSAIALCLQLGYCPKNEEIDIKERYVNTISDSVMGYVFDDEDSEKPGSADNSEETDEQSNNENSKTDEAAKNTDEEDIFRGVIENIASIMPIDIGLIYCKYYFEDSYIDAVEKIYNDVLNAYRKRFENNEWLDNETKAVAFKKIDNIIAVAGYPDNYTFAEIVPRKEGGTLYRNKINIIKNKLDTNIRQCADKEFTRVMMNDNPDEVNASYYRYLNSINIPAGIIGKPFYDPNESYAANLGSMGFLIGHEIGHAFDVNGSQHDENGAKAKWWSEESAAKYDELSKRFVDYYSKYEVADGVVQDSTITLAENMADFAGMRIVMDILAGDKEAQKEALESFAREWACVYSESELLSDENLKDVHSTKPVRVNAVVSSLDEFYDIYDVKEGDAMYVAPENRLQLW